MKILVTIEPGYKFNNRFNKIINGIIYSCKEHRYTFSMLDFPKIEPAEFSNQPIIVIAASTSWVSCTVQLLVDNNYHPIIVGFDFLSSSSTFITQNHYLDAYAQTYLHASNDASVAYIGFNPLSYCDTSKYSGLQDALHHLHIPLLSEDIFPLTTATECVNSFLQSTKKYDTIFCSNDTIAMILISKLKDIEKYKIVSFGDLYIKKYCSSHFFSLSPNYFDMGKISVSIFTTIHAHPNISNSSVFVRSQFDTENDIPMPNVFQQSFSRNTTLFSLKQHAVSDENSDILDKLSDTIERCDDTDIKMLQCFINNMSVEKTADVLYMSTNSVKRRFKKILTNSTIKNKKHFLEIVSRFNLDFNK